MKALGRTDTTLGLKKIRSKCLRFVSVSEDDKVKFAVCTFESRALTWWNGNVQTLGLANANQIPWSNPQLRVEVTGKLTMVNSARHIISRIPVAGGNSIQDVHALVVGITGTTGVIARSNKIERTSRGFPEESKDTSLLQSLRICMRHSIMGPVTENPQQNPNVVTGTFLLNDHYACILFDSGAEKSFVSSAFTHFIDIAPATLNTSYEIELADGKVVSTNTILRSCTLVLCNHVFKIDLLPTRLGSFDVIIGMDWLAYHRALIDCYEKIIRIPLPNGKILEVQGERPKKDLHSLACIKADEKKLDDIRVVRDFPEVFPDDLLGLPLVQEIEFRIDLIPGASPVVRSPYQLAPSEMLELSNQLKELQEKGFI
ncbi:putative reverse transcriptase domain-containing protein [Tanacetum coccineum]